MQRFNRKVAVITGAGSGIGSATALAFAREGASVVLAGRRVRELEEVAEQIAAPDRVAVIATDVAQPAAVMSLFARTLQRFGRVDAVFANAGVEGAIKPIAELTPEDFDYTVGINLKGVWLTAKYALEAMRRAGHGGAVVNTSSWLAHGAFPGTSIYSATKAGLDGMIRALALDAATDGIRFNNVNPGIIDTPMLRRLLTSDAAVAPFVSHTPARRLGQPDDVASAVLWLCSDEARFITGQNILVDGGYAIPGHRAA
jgi:NAD(P)-dependent dehydrogenase (short-subunit alcohol dehydrogenase family)